MKNQTILLLVLLLLPFTIVYSQGYEIKVKIPNWGNQEIILGHYFSKESMKLPDDTLRLNEKGIGVFKGNEKLPAGIYFIFLLKNKTFFDILLSDNQKFTVENDTTNLFENLKVINDKENQLFIKYQHQRVSNIKKIKELRELYTQATNEKEKKKLESKFKEQNEKHTNELEKIISENLNLFISKFIKATQEIKFPESLTDQKEKYFYIRNNYFKYFDFKDERLLRTPIYESRLNYYIEKVLPQIPDTLISEVDILINNTRHNKELFHFMLAHLYNTYNKSQLIGAENVLVHIVEKYYIPEADWAEKEFIDEWKNKLIRMKPALIGNIAPELKMIALPKDSSSIVALKEALETMKENGNAFLKDDKIIAEKMKQHKANYPNLSDSALRSQVIISELAMMLEEQFLPNFEGYISVNEQKPKYTILYFWRPDCSHCKESTPKFSKAFDEEEMGKYDVQVVPIYLYKNINEWEKYTKHINQWFDFVVEHKMLKWTNVWEPFGASNFRDKYNISNAPVLYLLDKNKKIIAKRIGHEQAFEIIKDIEKREKTN